MKIVCVLKSGGCYSPTHVHALRDMCLMWMPRHDFVCLTDVKGLACSTIPLQHDLKGWWSKLELFNAFCEGETLFLDLDTIIRGPCGQAVEAARSHEFVILRDVSRGLRNPLAMQSSIMFWKGSMRWIYEAFANQNFTSPLHGDQNFMEQAFREAKKTAIYWQDITDCIASYKMAIAGQSHPSHAPIVIFHGSPRPWQQNDIPYPFPVPQPSAFALRKGWVVPKHDKYCLDACLKEVNGLDRMLAHSPMRRTAFQAGGNFGIWAVALAEKFQHCVTAEPEHENFAVLEINTCDLPNITRYKMALGQTSGEINLHRVHGNAGAHYCMPGRGCIVTPIDALALNHLDFLQLDIEGYEHQAIMGAEKTIKEWYPLVVLELKGLGKKHGNDDQATICLLESWGYNVVDRVAKDVVFKHYSKI